MLWLGIKFLHIFSYKLQKWYIPFIDVYRAPGTVANLLGHLLLLILCIPVKSVLFTIVISQVRT